MRPSGDPIESLRGDHEDVLKTLAMLKDALEDDEGEWRQSILTRVLAYLAEQLPSHMEEEEELVYRHLTDVSMQIALTADHRRFRDWLIQGQDAIQAADQARLASVLGHLGECLTDHILIENTTVFPSLIDRPG